MHTLANEIAHVQKSRYYPCIRNSVGEVCDEGGQYATTGQGSQFFEGMGEYDSIGEVTNVCK
jgi:hypothetical protein